MGGVFEPLWRSEQRRFLQKDPRIFHQTWFFSNRRSSIFFDVWPTIFNIQCTSMFDPRYSIFNVLHDVLPTILQPFNYFPTTADQAMCADFPSREIFTQTFKILYLDFLTHTIMSLIRRDSSGISKCSSLLKISCSWFDFFSTFVDDCRFVKMFRFFTFSPVICCGWSKFPHFSPSFLFSAVGDFLKQIMLTILFLVHLWVY